MPYPITPIDLPNQPTTLPPNTTFYDFQIGEDLYCRVNLQIEPNQPNDNLVMGGQAWQMDINGAFVQAPLGYPSRTTYTNTTTPLTAMGDTASLQDDWLRYTVPYDPANPGDVVTVPSKPTEPGTEYGQVVWSEADQCLFKWTQGLAPSFAYVKAQEMQTILTTSLMRSGLSFANN